MNEVFNDATTAQIDARLYKDILEYEDRIEKTCIIIFIILILLFRGWIGYWLKFGIAIPNQIDMKPVNVQEAPIQKNYTIEEQEKKSFIYTSLINNHNIKIIPKAYYKLSGMTVAYNHDFLFINDFFDSAALYDLGAAWGKIGEKKVYDKYFQSYSAKTEATGSRILWTEYKRYPSPISIDYATSHWSHSHLVPANRNIMAALLKIKQWNNVQIEGELVDMEYTGKNGYLSKYHTSMSRTDSGSGDRGNGSCETVYVTKVKLGNFIYK